MSTELFPSDLPGITPVVQRPVRYSTGIQESVSGLEYRALWFNRPRARWTLDIEFLRSTLPTEFQELVSFYQRHGGRFDSFLFQDPDDYTVSASDPMKFGEGDGADTTFQLQRTLDPRALFRSRVLFDYTPGDDLTALGYVFTRASTATYVDAYGVIRSAGSGVIRDAHYIAGVRTLLLEVTSANLCLQSQTLAHATWTKDAGLTVPVTNAVAPDGTLTACRVDADGSGVSLDIRQTITFTGDGTKVVSVYLKPGTAAVTDVQISLAVGTPRHTVRITWATLAVTTQAGAGTIYDTEALANGWYRFGFAVDSVVATDTNQILILPAGTSAVAGTVYVWGVQVENAVQPSSYIATTTVTVTRASDVLYFPYTPVPQEETFFVDGFERTRCNVAPATTTILLGISDGASADPRTFLKRPSASTGYQYSYDPATERTTANVGGASTEVGARIRLRGLLGSNGAPSIGVTVNGGAESTAGPGTADPLAAAWSGQRLYVGSLGGALIGNFAFARVLNVAGTLSMDDLEEIAEEPGSEIDFYPEYQDGYEPVENLPALPVIYKDNVALIGGIDYTVNLTTGIVTFTTAPAAGTMLSWSGSFYKRVRFDSDAWATARMLRGLWESRTLELVQVL